MGQVPPTPQNATSTTTIAHERPHPKQQPIPVPQQHVANNREEAKHNFFSDQICSCRIVVCEKHFQIFV